MRKHTMWQLRNRLFYGNYSYKKKGFTLVELIVALALLSIAFGVIYSFFLTNQKLINREQNDIDLHFEMSNAATRLSDELKESRCLTGAAIKVENLTMDCNTNNPLIFEGENSNAKSALYLRIVSGSAVGEEDGKYLEVKRIITGSSVTPPSNKYLYVKSVKLHALSNVFTQTATLDSCSGVEFELSGSIGKTDKRTVTSSGIVYFRINDDGN